ncbi:hypothetical protein ACEWY4_001626 [Coilia grayii]|uniref:SEA domain-containing protein n=1 Tax=Coilia grayii TaxID=363190 RepID=A0ABD1KTK5_9TELE
MDGKLLLTIILILVQTCPASMMNMSAVTTTPGNMTSSPMASHTTNTLSLNASSQSLALNTTSHTYTTESMALNTTSYTHTTESMALNTTSHTHTTESMALNTTSHTFTTDTPAPNTSSPGQTVTSVFELIFSSNETFSSSLSNHSSEDFRNRVTLTRTQIEPIYRASFPGFTELMVLNFMNGSIVTDAELHFSSGQDGGPTAESVTDTLRTAVANGNISFPVTSSSINVTRIGTITTESPTTPHTTPETETNSGTLAVSHMTSAMSAVTTTPGNMTSSPTASHTTNTLSLNASSQSLALNTTSHTYTTESMALNTTSHTHTTESMALNTTSHTFTTDTPAPNTSSPGQTVTSVFELIFSSNETFSSSLSNHSSEDFRNRVTLTRTQIEPIYRASFSGFTELMVLNFTNGSIVTDAELHFSSGQDGGPTAESVTDTLRTAVVNGNISFPVTSSSINVTRIGTITTESPTTPHTTPETETNSGTLAVSHMTSVAAAASAPVTMNHLICSAGILILSLII